MTRKRDMPRQVKLPVDTRLVGSKSGEKQGTKLKRAIISYISELCQAQPTEYECKFEAFEVRIGSYMFLGAILIY